MAGLIQRDAGVRERAAYYTVRKNPVTLCNIIAHLGKKNAKSICLS